MSLVVLAMPHFIVIVYTQVCSNARRRKPVNRHPFQSLFVCPRLVIGPFVKLFIDPGEKTNRTVSEGVAECLWFSTLLDLVAHAVLCDIGSTLQANSLSYDVCVYEVSQSKAGVLRQKWRLGLDGV